MNNVHERCVFQMCEKTYQHPGIEYSDSDRDHSVAMRSLKWAIDKEIRELKLKSNGINLVYAAHTSKGIKAHEIEIQENRGKYSFFLDGKSVRTFDTLADCETWAKNAGHIDKAEQIGEARTAPTKPAELSKPVIPTKRKVAPADSTADKLAKFLSWKSPNTTKYGWR